MRNNIDIDEGFWRDRKVFITGATGFLGSWLTLFLTDAGSDVTCLVRDEIPRSNFHLMGLEGKTNVVRGDFRDMAVVDRAINEYETETVFHLGAQTIVGTANNNPVPTLTTNINGTINVLEASRRNKTVKGVVVSSSDKAYGTSEVLPYDESTPLRGEYPYDVSKSAADLIAQSFFKTFGLPVCITRCANFFGGGDLNFSRIVPGTIRDIYRGRQPVIRSDGKFVREYLYIKDAAEAYVKLAEGMEKREGVVGEAFNFGSKERLSVLELVGKIARAMGSGLEPAVLNQARGEIREQYLSSGKAKRVLCWEARHSIDEGLEETVGWYRDFLNGKNE
jgi:CDP-glucose 4,6-dehydratase